MPLRIESRSTANTTARPGTASVDFAKRGTGVPALMTSSAPLPYKRALRTRRGWPSTVTVKSEGCRSVTGRPLVLQRSLERQNIQAALESRRRLLL